MQDLAYHFFVLEYVITTPTNPPKSGAGARVEPSRTCSGRRLGKAALSVAREKGMRERVFSGVFGHL